MKKPIYKDFLENASKPYYGYAEVFGESPLQWVKSFVMTHYNINMHSQAFYELNIIVKGEGMHYIESKRLPVQKGDIFIIPPDVRHGYSSIDELDVFHILIHQLFFMRYNEELHAQPYFNILFNIEPLMRADGSLNLHLKIDSREFERIDYLLNNLLEWTAFTDEPNTAMSKGVTLILIAQLCDFYHKHHLNSFPEKKIRLDTDFMKSISFIYENYNQKIHIGQLAEMSFLSVNTYINRFKKIMHATPAAFILDYRIKNAQEILLQSDKPLLEIALQTGFYDTSHFIKSFKKTTGCSPMAFRREYKMKK